MGYAPGTEFDSSAPWNEVSAKEHKFDFEGKVWHNETGHKVRIRGAWEMYEGDKLIRAYKFSYIGAIPVTTPNDEEYDVCECIREELGGNVVFNF